MKQIKDIFPNMATLAQCAPVTETNMAIDDLKAAFASSWKQLTALIPDAVLTAIADGSDDGMKSALSMALANRVMANNAVFSAYVNRKAGTDTYKYEVEGMKRSWMENYFSAMDTLLSELTRQADEVAPADENVADAETGTGVANAESGTEEVAPAETGTTPSIGELFRESRFYRMAAGCHIRTAEQFDTIYPIDLSYLFSWHWPRRLFPRPFAASTSWSSRQPSVTSSTRAMPTATARMKPNVRYRSPTCSTARPTR